MSLKEDLAGIIPADKLHLLGRYEMIGDIAVISLPAGLEPYKVEAADAILAKRKNIRTVLNKLSKTEGDRRVPRYEILKGEGTIASYQEYGFSYRFDISKVFFNPDLKYERHRIAGLAMGDEHVLLPFAGAGPFAIPLAAKGCRVLAVEKSTVACKWLLLNAQENGAGDNVDILNADVLAMPLLPDVKFDRAVIPTPYGMDTILDTLLPLVREGGNIHFYTFKKRYEIAGLIEKFENMKLNVEGVRRCGNVAPGVGRWAFHLSR
jgi:tRNA (guanine37-N1)-methyltransferase